MRCLLVVFLYFSIQTASAIPKEIEMCIWVADIAGSLQVGRQYSDYAGKHRLWHRELVSILLEQHKQKPFVIKRILKIFDYVWDTFDITKTETFVFKESYTSCVNLAKRIDDIYY